MNTIVAELTWDLKASIGWAGPTVDARAGLVYCSEPGSGPSCVIACSDPLLADRHESERFVCIGHCRLDDRHELADCPSDVVDTSDATLLCAAIERHGLEVLKRIIGDFALIVWDKSMRSLIACRDAFGVKPLYYQEIPGGVRFSTSATILGNGRAYDRDYLAEFLILGANLEERTVYSGVRSVPAGVALIAQRRRLIQSRFWDISDYEPTWLERRDTAEEFRHLFERAVRNCIQSGGVWSQLSGGIDSSSIVCMAEHLWRSGSLARRLSGTVTFVDTLGRSDERKYVDAVTTRYGIRNESLSYGWPWQDDGELPPHTDGPTPAYAVYARDRAMGHLLRNANAKVLLSGEASDLYLGGTPVYIADLVARGKLGAAIRETLRWALANRRSFARYFGRYGLLPLLPIRIRRAFGLELSATPEWLDRDFIRTSVADRLTANDGRCGDKYATMIRAALRLMPYAMPSSHITELVDVRFPYLYRPLVQFALQLPPMLRSQPKNLKAVLRSAMQAHLPEAVRTRTGKGGIGARAVWAFTHERPTIERLFKQSVLEELGCIDRSALTQTLRAARAGARHNTVLLHTTLSLETWLSVHSGRWRAKSRNEGRPVVAGR